MEGPGNPPRALSAVDRASLCEVLDRVLNKGVVVAGDITISVADIDLIYLGLQVVLTSIEKARDIAASSAPNGVRNGAVTEADDGFR
ncbi:MAG: hypothetical protein A3J29_14910 [Acidobacteria bacterium RIFCSPLOWO2_12_FULL_67_14b]|nr:MAG: hypothetical protein A3H29_07190 [Acidobacteria bacterium RIFCSPLOWO2_02_FULL_67_21]OFW43211.1 MAG: hypothetical protein A3J29_14910 [Acidobacteria bacterium RIFCSPLOWO2_12_FULL_67_14b]